MQVEALRSGKPFPEKDPLIALPSRSGSELLTLDEDQLKMKESLMAKGVAIRSPEKRCRDRAIRLSPFATLLMILVSCSSFLDGTAISKIKDLIRRGTSRGLSKRKSSTCGARLAALTERSRAWFHLAIKENGEQKKFREKNGILTAGTARKVQRNHTIRLGPLLSTIERTRMILTRSEARSGRFFLR